MNNNTTDEQVFFTLRRLGTVLRNHRLIKGDKQESVSCSTGISHSVISKIENGRYTQLGMAQLIRLLVHYGISLEGLAQEMIDSTENI